MRMNKKAKLKQPQKQKGNKLLTPDDTRDIARYTVPFALGKKQRQHLGLLNEILHQTKSLEKVASMYCGNSKKLVNVYFERLIIQND